MEEQMVDLPPILAKRVMVFDKHHYLRVKYIEPYVQSRITQERNRILGVVERLIKDWLRYHIGSEPVASERLARQNGALTALQALKDEITK